MLSAVLLLRRRRVLLVGKVSVAGPDAQVAIPRRMRFNAHLAIAAVAAGVRRLVCDAVLVADITRDLRADLVHFLQVCREERHAAGLVRERLQRALGALHAWLGFAEDPDRVDGRARIILDGPDRTL